MPRAWRHHRKVLVLLGILLLVSPALPGIVFLVMGAVVGGGFFKVVSSSMEPTLHPNQSYLALPFDRDRDLVRGRVVTFLPPDDTGIQHTKRIIALAGDRVALVNGRPVVNSQFASWTRARDYRITERTGTGPSYVCRLAGQSQTSSCLVSRWTETLTEGTSYDVLDAAVTPQDDFPETIVAAGHVFVMGDNRDNSIDSRFPQIGMIPIENIAGVAWRHYFGPDAGDALGRFLVRIQ